MRSEVKEQQISGRHDTKAQIRSGERANSISFISATSPPFTSSAFRGLRVCVFVKCFVSFDFAEYWNIICILHIAGFSVFISLSLSFAPSFSFHSFYHRQNGVDSCICHLLKFRQITWQSRYMYISRYNANWIYRLL